MTAVQDPLFATVAGHLITFPQLLSPSVVKVGGMLERRMQSWFTWSCSCGEVPSGRWSHRELAEQVADVHVEAMAS
jgi:hypothetical protein